MTTFPFNLRKPIIIDPTVDPTVRNPLTRGPGMHGLVMHGPIRRGPFKPSPFSGPIVFCRRAPLLAIPTQPVGDPVPRPSTPQPSPQRDPSDPVQAPHPREPELPAIDPHEPGLPDTRIGNLYEQDLYEEMSIGDPPHSSSVQCWLI